MAFPTKDGKRKNSKFRQARYDRENGPPKESMQEPKERPEQKESGEPPMHAQEEQRGGMEGADHEEIKNIAAEHGPAHTVNMVHDREGQMSHVHSVHEDGHEHHADHKGEGHVKHAHEHAMHAAGESPQHEEPDGDEHEQMGMGGKDEDDFEAEPL
jgi:hypothetical protein